jgi:hypothetical protein
MVELSPEQTAEMLNHTVSIRNEIVDILKRDDVSLNVGILAVVSLAEEIRSRLGEEERLRTDLAGRSFNALCSIEKTIESVLVAGEN